MTSGTAYTYTVRCVSADRSEFASSYDQTGKTITYVAAPVITSLTNVNGGVKISWNAVNGAQSYRLFRKTAGGSWTTIRITSAASYVDRTAVSGKTYTYTVRCVTSDGKTFTSSYDNTGKSIRYIAAPKVTVVNTSSGIRVSWGKVEGAQMYRVFRKTGSGGWTTLKDSTSLFFTDTNVKAGTTYTYTVRCISSDRKTFTSSYDQTGKSIKR